eukprot:UN01609
MLVLKTKLAFCDKRKWKNVCLKRNENMYLASLWKETITVRPIQLSDCSHYVPAFSPPSTVQKVVQRKRFENHGVLFFFEKQNSMFSNEYPSKVLFRRMKVKSWRLLIVEDG